MIREYEDYSINHEEEDKSTKVGEDKLTIFNDLERAQTPLESQNEEDPNFLITVEEIAKKQEEFLKENGLLFSLSVDGSEHTKFAFDILINEFIQGNKLELVYIYNSKQDSEYNYRNRKETVTSLYETLILTKFTPERALFIPQDYNRNYDHPVEQVNRVSHKNKSKFLFLGYNGLKGPRCDNKELAKGVDYLLRESRMPTVLIKEGNLRGQNRPRFEKDFKGYKWLFVFDRSNSDCHYIINIFSSLLDIDKDYVHGLTLLPSYMSYDDVRKNFFSQLTSYGFKENQLGYHKEEYTRNPSKFVTTFVNDGEEHHFDFVVFYNNPEKHKVEKENSEAAKVIKQCSANICFVNGIFCLDYNLSHNL